ncbi:MAG TPA: hypothetical protein VLK22_00085 [Candidatus Udaeobacter sp.]|nr:hypothetical protein [Candidatus Udaeobacter sp.]
MDKAKVERIFNSVTLFFINAAIIIIAESTGQLFFRMGLIHIIALLFIALSVIRIFVRYYSYDSVLEKFFQASLAALFVFTIAHIVEYFNMTMGMSAYYSDAALVNTANFYLISLIIIIIGADAFLRIYDNRSRARINFLIGLIAALVVLIFVFTAKKDLASLELDEPMPYVYLAAVFTFGLLALRKVRLIGKRVGISTAFAKLLSASIILLMLSTVPYILYDLLEEHFGFPLYQIMYLSHFIFYASLSLLFLAFGRVKIMGGVYEDLNKNSSDKPDSKVCLS